MNPVEIGTGKSFKGLAAYLLHDAGRASTAERVAWAESVNLDGADPETAWRLMAATAMNADQLKAAAGVKKGKKAVNTAFHFALTFNPDDAPSPELQRLAVQGSLKALGLDAYQALAVAHRDTDHAHVHVMVNLIHPETGTSAASKQDGRPAALSNSQRKLSAWAGQFEREHGLIVTEGRLANANKRGQGEQVDARRKPRNVYERDKVETQDRRRDYKKRDSADQARNLAADGRDMNDRHSTEWTALKATYHARKNAAYAATGDEVRDTLKETKEGQKRAWSAISMRQRSEVEDFRRGEKTTLGRLWHGAATFRERALAGDALGGFLAAFSQTERLAIVQRKHDRERAALNLRLRADVSEAIDAIKARAAEERAQARKAFLLDCAALRRTQQEERAAMRMQWQQHSATRRGALTKERSRGDRPERSRDVGRGRGLEPG
jgi:hypothetical protein